MRLLIALFALLAGTSALAQETAARVLFSLGDVVIIRGASSLTPGPGTEVRMGDTIRLGEQSHMQLRFTDESLVSLQPGTTFEVTEYAYAGKEPGNQR